PQQSIDQNIASNQILSEECENPKDLVKVFTLTNSRIIPDQESYEKEKNISFEEFIKKLKKKNAQTNSISHESEDEKNAQDLHVQNSEKKMDMKDKHFRFVNQKILLSILCLHLFSKDCLSKIRSTLNKL
ncbi:hypothetical protein HZS_1284, partial [Henneguya salminicola]